MSLFVYFNSVAKKFKSLKYAWNKGMDASYSKPFKDSNSHPKVLVSNGLLNCYKYIPKHL
jgi:hypothetical protein